MEPTAEKVTAFVTRDGPQRMELLVFEHSHAGIQLPAGTVEAGEPHAVAAAREAYEETGLTDLPPGRLLAALSETLPAEHYMMVTTARVYSRPDPTSFDWASIRNGLLVQRHRAEAEYTHVTFTDWYRRSEPPYVTYQITGWVPTAVLTRQVTRYFYHFPYHGQTPETWTVDTDNQRFRLFWAPLTALPPINAYQRPWVDILTQAESST
jgi:8-oxo-dGTP pyrophosphatase MutT (NUDIX family)